LPRVWGKTACSTVGSQPFTWALKNARVTLWMRGSLGMLMYMDLGGSALPGSRSTSYSYRSIATAEKTSSSWPAVQLCWTDLARPPVESHCLLVARWKASVDAPREQPTGITGLTHA